MTRIIACVDGSAATPSVARAGQWLANRSEASLLFLHALEQPDVPVWQDASGAIGLGAQEGLLSQLVELEATRAQLALRQGQALLAHLQAEAEAAGVASVAALQRHGALLDVLAEQVSDADVTVLGRCGASHEVFEGVIGSHIESVIRTTAQPVLLVAEDFNPPADILLAYDGSDTAEKALRWIIQSPVMAGTRCHVVGVCHDGGLEASIQRAERDLSAAGFRTQSATVAAEEPWQGVVEYQKAHRIDLTVMGAFGHSRIRQFLLGSQTTQLLKHSVTPLFLIR